jgi:SAM-dependent methyltransferase
VFESTADWIEALRLTAAEGPLRKRRLRRALRFVRDRRRFVSQGGRVDVQRAMLDDAEDEAGAASGHYFHQDLLVATRIHRAAPRRHVDVGSRVDGFVAHVASFRRIEVIDIRPLAPSVHENIVFRQADLMRGAGVEDGMCDSLSCLHALEHFGLGRYGDPLDPQGHLKGFANLCRMLEPGGTLYLGVPIGPGAVHFNAHRVFAPEEPLRWAADRLQLAAFDYVDDAGDLHLASDPAQLPPLRYGCGIYTLRRTAAA